MAGQPWGSTRLVDGDPRSSRRQYEIGPEDLMDAPEFSARGGIVRARALTDTLVA
jgi:hypothetical protein